MSSASAGDGGKDHPPNDKEEKHNGKEEVDDDAFEALFGTSNATATKKSEFDIVASEVSISNLKYVHRAQKQPVRPPRASIPSVRDRRTTRDRRRHDRKRPKRADVIPPPSKRQL